MSPQEALSKWLIANLDNLWDSSALQAELSRRLKEIDPRLTWEIGPASDGLSFLAFSPSGHRDLWQTVDALVRTAPSIPGWEFLSGKPRKGPRGRCFTLRHKGQVAEIDARTWRYFLTMHNGGEFFDVHVVTGPVSARREAVDLAADLLVESELGERIFTDFVRNVDVADDEYPEDRTSSIDDLFDHISSLRRQDS